MDSSGTILNVIFSRKGHKMFGEILQKLRKTNGMSQVELGRKLGVTKQAVSNWENNNILPSIDLLIRIARFFSVSPDYLLEMDKNRYIEVTDLTDEEIAHIQQLIDDIRKDR